MDFNFKNIDKDGFVRIWNSDFQDGHADSHKKSFEDSAEIEWKALLEKHLLLMFEASIEDSVVGYIFLSPKEDGSAHLGYGLYPDYRGQGLAVKMCEEFLIWKIPLLDSSITHLLGTTLKENIASQRVLHKLGFNFHEETVEEGCEYLRFKRKLT